MAREKKAPEADAQQNDAPIEIASSVMIPLEVRDEIAKKAAELKEQHNIRKVFAIVVEGDEDDDKPFYIAYLKRPNLMQFSQYMNFVQKDIVQANKMMAQNVFLAGDRELIDDDELFLYGAMSQLTHLIDSRNGELVKK